eukprot:6248905-Pyramimonas_sp.AAC.1
MYKCSSQGSCHRWRNHDVNVTNGEVCHLGAVGVGPCVGHGEQPGLVVLQLEVLVAELSAVDGFATGAVALREVAPLRMVCRFHATRAQLDAETNAARNHHTIILPTGLRKCIKKRA